MAAVLVRGESSQGELLVELVNAPGATRRVRRPQVGLKHTVIMSGLQRGPRQGVKRRSWIVRLPIPVSLPVTV